MVLELFFRIYNVLYYTCLLAFIVNFFLCIVFFLTIQQPKIRYNQKLTRKKKIVLYKVVLDINLSERYSSVNVIYREQQMIIQKKSSNRFRKKKKTCFCVCFITRSIEFDVTCMIYSIARYIYVEDTLIDSV